MAKLAVAQLVGEANLPALGVPLLGAIEVGDPDHRPMPVQYLADHTGAAAGANDVDHHIAVLEHPVPAGHPADPHRGLVRTDHPGATQPRQNGGDIGIEPRRRATERGIQRAFANPQGVEVQQ